MADEAKYVEVRLGGGIPQFIPLDQWQATDPAKRAEYTVLAEELTEAERRQRETQHARNAAATAHYADPPGGGAG
jgi:hypothetical protein